MSDVAIRIEGLGKQYRIGGLQARHATLREQLSRTLTAPFRALRRRREARSDQRFWALRDVSFDVKRGEVVGIIGRNGAGKSTLLKILSRITEPTTGEVDLHGRVGSLLEVGTGFHPELTGRENVYLNGAILGMKRGEIARKFDEIVAFAEVGQFIDTPAKHYSSGMYMRLAFAVAAHLQPDILVVDEVLAVGDAQFQEKCLGKIGDIAGQGRTVLFVSHNMHAVSLLCGRAMLLRQGALICEGATQDVIAHYEQTNAKAESGYWEGCAGDDTLMLLSTELVNGTNGNVFRTDEDITVRVQFRVGRPILGLVCAVEVCNHAHVRLAYSSYDDSEQPPPVPVQPGVQTWEMTIPGNTLAAGTYQFGIDLAIHNVRRVTKGEGTLWVRLENLAGIGRRYSAHAGVVRPAWNWRRVMES
jgi:lipopolysaccharide transport system ATP-binding protein